LWAKGGLGFICHKKNQELSDTREVSFFCGQKFHLMPTKTGILFGSFILELERISGREFEIYSKSGWFSGILNQNLTFWISWNFSIRKVF
jgi:hypothetical protein